MRFKPGDQVVCTKKDGWCVVYRRPMAKRQASIGPKYNEVVTVSQGVDVPGYPVFIILEEYSKRDGFGEIYFEPLITDEQLAEALKEVKSEVAETIDAH